MLANVEYQIGTYHGTVSVNVEPEAYDDDEHIIALARRKLKRDAGPMPLGLYAARFVVHRSESGNMRRTTPSGGRCDRCGFRKKLYGATCVGCLATG